MNRILVIIVVVGLIAFVASVAVRWGGDDNTSERARTPPTTGKAPPEKPPRRETCVLVPGDFFAVGSIASGQSVVFDTGDLKRPPTVTIGPDTLRGEVRKIADVPVAVFCFNDVYVDRPVRTTGVLPLAIVSRGSIVVKTRLTVSGSPGDGTAGGAGVCGGHQGGAVEADGHGPGAGRGGRGAGGGSFGGRGADGQAAKATSTYGRSPMSWMQGGSGGGGGVVGGGAGGGAIQLAAAKAVEITSAGALLADGGAGASNAQGAGGGGSGGAIVLSAPAITIHGALSARGGGGGRGQNHGAGAGGGGRIAVFFARSFTGKLPTPTQHTAGGKAERQQANGQPGTTIPTPSLAWWTFDEIRPGARVKLAVDSMGQSHAMLWNLDDSALVPGVCGKGLQLDGEAAYVEVYSKVPILQLGRGSMTLALWVRTEVLAEGAVLLGKGMPMVEGGQLLAQWLRAGYGKRFVIQKRLGRIAFAVEHGDTRSAVSVAAEEVETGSWVHLAAVRDADAKTVSLFVDGRKLAEAPDSTTDVSSHFNLYLGAGEDGAVKHFGRAAIDDVRLFAKPLGADALMGLIQHAAVGGGRMTAVGSAEPAGPTERWIDPSLSEKERRALERANKQALRRAKSEQRRREAQRLAGEAQRLARERLERRRR